MQAESATDEVLQLTNSCLPYTVNEMQLVLLGSIITPIVGMKTLSHCAPLHGQNFDSLAC